MTRQELIQAKLEREVSPSKLKAARMRALMTSKARGKKT